MNPQQTCMIQTSTEDSEKLVWSLACSSLSSPDVTLLLGPASFLIAVIAASFAPVDELQIYTCCDWAAISSISATRSRDPHPISGVGQPLSGWNSTTSALALAETSQQNEFWKIQVTGTHQKNRREKASNLCESIQRYPLNHSIYIQFFHQCERKRCKNSSIGQ